MEEVTRRILKSKTEKQGMINDCDRGINLYFRDDVYTLYVSLLPQAVKDG
jgi:hypothetical protein